MRQTDRHSEPTVAVAASFPAASLARPLRFWLNEVLDLDVRVELAGDEQVIQTLLDPRSIFAANSGGLNVVLLTWEDWEQGAAKDLDENIRLLASALATSAASARAAHLVCLCPPLTGVRAADAERRQRELDDRLTLEVAPLPGVEVVTSAELARLYPVEGDPGGDQLAQIAYRRGVFVVLAAVIARRLHAAITPPYKAIIVDCDRTLWGGVCAEDGPAGVVLDAPRRALQEFLVSQREAGMLLGLASKNDADDVAAVFAARREMPLRWQHFAAHRINWDPKSGNIRAIADELGVATESVVFLDDDPLECAEVRGALPEVLTLELPPDSIRLPAFLRAVWAFDRRKLTEEDRIRATHYHQESGRRALRGAATSLEEFLAALQLDVRIRPLASGDVTRAAQLAQRVTQFNLSVIRRSEAELGTLWRAGSLEAVVVEVSDRFGDYGLVGLVLWTTAGDRLTVDSFLLSCRALGRGVEHRMLAQLGRLAEDRGLTWVELPFVETPRNRPLRDFLHASVGEYRQPGGPASYLVPVRIAAAVRHAPSSGQPLPAARDGDRTAPDGGTAARAARGRAEDRSRRLARIAADLAEPTQILMAFAAWQRTPESRVAGTYVAPRSDVERHLAEIWGDVLGLERISIHDVFFELDGDSLGDGPDRGAGPGRLRRRAAHRRLLRGPDHRSARPEDLSAPGGRGVAPGPGARDAAGAPVHAGTLTRTPCSRRIRAAPTIAGHWTSSSPTRRKMSRVRDSAPTTPSVDLRSSGIQ